MDPRQASAGASNTGTAAPAAAAGSSSAAPPDMQFVFENPADESDQHVVNWLEDVARPVVEAGMKSADDMKSKLALWMSAQRLEVLRNGGHWQLEKISGGLPKLAKKWTWSSPSYHSAYLQETTVNAHDKSVKVTYDCIAFLFLITTDIKWLRAYETVHAADRRKDLPAYVADVESLMHEAVLSQVKTKCAYALKTTRVYIGMTARTGVKRHKEHTDTPVSTKVAEERERVPWQDWKARAIYVPRQHEARGMPDAFLLFVEHLGMVVTNSVAGGLNTNAFDKEKKGRITAAEIESVVVRTLDKLCPVADDGLRHKVGPERIEPAFFRRHAKIFEDVPLRPSTLHQIMKGMLWRYQVRRALDKHGADPHIWPAQRRPAALLATAAEREVAKEAREGSTRIGEEYPEWKAAREKDRNDHRAAAEPSITRKRAAHPAYRDRDCEAGNDSDRTGQDEQADSNSSEEEGKGTEKGTEEGPDDDDDTPWYDRPPKRTRQIGGDDPDWKASFSTKGRKKP